MSHCLKLAAIPKYVLLVGQVFGLFPLRYVQKTKSGPSIEFSRMLYLNNLMIVTVLTTMSCLALYYDFTGYLKGQPIIMIGLTNVWTVFLDIIPLNLIVIIVFISTAKKYHNVIRISHILEKIDKTLDMKLKSCTMSKFKVLLIYFYVTTIIFITGLKIMLGSNWKTIIYVFPMLAYYIQTAMFVQFTFIVTNFTKRFQVINGKIKEEVESQTYSQILAKDLSFFEICRKQGWFQSAEHLQLLTDSYFQLFEAVREASAFYGSQLFFAVVSSFTHNTVTLNFILQQIVSASLHSEEIQFLWYSLIWMVTHIAHLVLLIRPCTTLSETASQTPAMVCRLLSKDVNSSAIRNELKSFLLKLLHFEVRFSAMGFFEIHNHILTSIAGSVATYLVVMIQFKPDN